MKIPLRQKLANRMMRFHEFPSIKLEDLFVDLIYFIAGREPYFWIHYGENCICCKRGWHK